MSQEEKVCVFCGSVGKLTVEHIWGNWTKRIIPRKANKHFAAQVRVMKPNELGTPTVRIRAGDPLDATAAIVCANCNSTWMSGIQERAKPHLIPLFRGEPCLLDARAQTLVAVWIAMATMTGEFSTQPVPIVGVPQPDRTRLSRSQSVPEGWGIWIGRRKVVSSEMQWIHAAFPILDADSLPDILDDNDRITNSQSTAFTIGELFICAISTPFPEITAGWDWRTARRARTRLVQIWPAKYLGIFWPPPIIFDEDARSFGTAIIRYYEDLALRGGYR